jgi:hypothetical protein
LRLTVYGNGSGALPDELEKLEGGDSDQIQLLPAHSHPSGQLHDPGKLIPVAWRYQLRYRKTAFVETSGAPRKNPGRLLPQDLGGGGSQN